MYHIFLKAIGLFIIIIWSTTKHEIQKKQIEQGRWIFLTTNGDRGGMTCLLILLFFVFYL
jgi:hypothetical protein